jgi:hypothetical protein
VNSLKKKNWLMVMTDELSGVFGRYKRIGANKHEALLSDPPP